MVLEKCVLTDVSKNITSGNEITSFEELVWLEVPFFVLIEARKIDTSWYENVLCSCSNLCERSLDSVENGLQNT